MLVVLNSLRSHFFKHLPCITNASTSVVLHNHHPINPCPRLPTSLSFPSHCAITTQIPIRRGVPGSVLNSRNLSTTASSNVSETSSFTSPYLSVHIECRKDISDMLSEALLCFGASSTCVDVQDYDEDDNNEVSINAIFADYQDVKECISHAANSIGLVEEPTYEVKKGDHSDWIKKSQESFRPVEVAKGLWVVPQWETPPDLHATNIILNPGLAFGNGEHPTTKLCLLLLHGLIKGGELFLDYGTGSGVLAIAAIKFGAALSVGLDVDPLAITAARQNASLNNIEAERLQLHLVHGGKTPLTAGVGCLDGGENTRAAISETNKYDVVVANILVNPLLDLADNIVSYAKPGAVVAVSGIISEQVPRITERYSRFLDDISVSWIDDWACVRGTKK